MVAGSDGPPAMPAMPVRPKALHRVDARVEHVSRLSAMSTGSRGSPGIGHRARCPPNAVSNPETSRSAVGPGNRPWDDRGTAHAMSADHSSSAAEKAGPAGRDGPSMY